MASSTKCKIYPAGKSLSSTDEFGNLMVSNGVNGDAMRANKSDHQTWPGVDGPTC